MKRGRVCLVLLITILFIAPLTASMADGRGRMEKHFQNSFEHKKKDSKKHGAGDHGNETTGQIAIWLLIAANLSVLASISIKAANRRLSLSEETRRKLAEINKTQKKHLMRFHCFLNPGILAVALIHWSLSRCVTTSLPELGLISMLILAGLGLAVKFRLAPSNIARSMYKIHTHPLAIGSVAALLLTGHLIVD